MPRMNPQKRIDPSSDDQRLTMVTHIGTCVEPTCATYCTLKLCVISAYSITPVAASMSAANAYANLCDNRNPSGERFAPAVETRTEARMRKRPSVGIISVSRLVDQWISRFVV